MKNNRLLSNLAKDSKIYLKSNCRVIITGISIFGVTMTSVMTAKATIKAMELINEKECEYKRNLTKSEIIKTSIPCYVSPLLMGVNTIICILGISYLNRKQQISFASAYTFINNSYKEFKSKVIELYGDRSDTEVIKSISNDKYQNYDRTEFSDKKQLFYDEFSGRFFESTLEDIMLAQYHFNRNFALRETATLNELYDFYGLEHLPFGDVIGWDAYIGEESYGYKWVDFTNYKTLGSDGQEYYIIHMPFDPHDIYEDY